MSHINALRSNPQEFASKVEAAISYIKVEDGKLIFETESGSKIALLKGEEAFRECANKLRTLAPLPVFEFSNDLCAPVPEVSADWKKQSSVEAALGKIRAETAGKYTEFGFNLDLGVSDPEMSCILQVVDDSGLKGKRSATLLNKDFKYCGIAHAAKGKKQFCAYLTFAR